MRKVIARVSRLPRWLPLLPAALVLATLSHGAEKTMTEESMAEEAAFRQSSPEVADIVSVKASGKEKAYNFAVKIRSPDLGCEQFADSWEVFGEDGDLLYRRVLRHSHVDEQPFVRSGGPVRIRADEVVWVVVHMHPGGYGGVAFRGSVQTEFKAADVPHSLVTRLDQQKREAPNCAF